MKFAQTWWGEQWLAAFNGIDYGNRLPRGRTYAGKGAASNIEISNTSVNAHVQGRRRRPYAVTISLDPFSETQRRLILDTLSSNPKLLSRLLNRQLPVQLLPLLKEQGIRLFPDSWEDMRASCSCPDWAVPCKHIAAVIYLVANEIDKNPFLVFLLHGLDLIHAVEQRTGVELLSLASPRQLSAPWSQEPQVNSWQVASTTCLDTFDLSVIPALAERTFGILSDRTLFHSNGFHKLLQGHYKRATRAAIRFDREDADSGDIASRLADLTVIIDDRGCFLKAETDGQPINFYGQDSQLSPAAPAPDKAASRQPELNALLQLLHGLDSNRDPLLCPHLLLWQHLFRLALKLIEQQAMIPAACLTGDQQLQICWRPAPFSEPVTLLLESFYPLCPANLVVMAITPKGQRHPLEHYGSARDQVHGALHLLMAFFMQQGLDNAPQAQQKDPVSQLFCQNGPQRFDSFETREHPRVIHHWLAPLYLSEREHRLSVWVEEQDDDSGSFSLDVRVELAGEIQTLDLLLDEPGLSAIKVNVLTDLALLVDHFPAAERLYGATREQRLVFSLAEFGPVFSTILPALRALGISVHLPAVLHKLVRPRLNLSLSGKNTAMDGDQSYLNLSQLLQFSWQIAIGEQRLSIDAFRKLIQHSDGLVRLHDQYVMIDGDQLQQWLKKLDRLPESLSRFELLKAGLAGELDGAGVDLGEEVRALFEQLLRTEPASLPAGLNAELRPYQRRGFEWLAQNARLGFGSLIADDMGLGKTVQVIALILHLKETGQLAEQSVLVVVPTSLLTNWHKEIQRFAPGLKSCIFHGSGRQLDAEPADVVLTSYGLVRSDTKMLAKRHWRALIIDEAQNIKNPASQQSRAVKKLKSDIRIGMSGTPVENRLREYWSLFDFTNKGYLGSQKHFQEQLASPIEKDRDLQRLQQFRKITAPFILRRLKTDKTIISDLPEKLESNRYCSLSKEQAALYQSTVDSIMAQLESGPEGVERRGLIFKLLNALKQICNSPAQYLGLSTAVTEQSGKLAAFIEIMREVKEAGEKALIFTQYTRMGELLTKQLQTELGMDVPFLHGGLSRNRRDELVESFQSDSRTRAMVLSLKAGGTGLNLTAASQVIHYDLWWNPAVEAQATDRAFRIGQHMRVLVHRLITEHSFEEKIDNMIQSKKELANLTVASGEQWITELSDTELRALVSLSGA
ncbi:MAG: DEAD/DEAH box helicase [Amphritea sp.]